MDRLFLTSQTVSVPCVDLCSLMLSFVRIRITKQLEVEPEEVEVEPVLSESETESQPKTTPRRRSKQNRKDAVAPAAEQVQEKVCDI